MWEKEEKSSARSSCICPPAFSLAPVSLTPQQLWSSSLRPNLLSSSNSVDHNLTYVDGENILDEGSNKSD